MVNPIRTIYLMLRDIIMERGGLQPKGIYWYSNCGNQYYDDQKKSLPVPNLVGSFHNVLTQFWQKNGLGHRCLLVSECKPVKEAMREYYSGVDFVTTDLFPDLTTNIDEHRPDYIWDVCETPPQELCNNKFDSVICHALLEHVIDPTTAIYNMIKLLNTDGKIYLMTHTPSFHKHSYPRDYVRFHQDYFEDLPDYFSNKYKIKISLIELYSSKGVICVCYEKK